MNYQDFLATKVKNTQKVGFRPKSFNEMLFPFQKHIVSEALEKGRFGIFADCGLGKTFMQLEWGHQISDYTKCPVLLICPLAVGGQTIKEAAKFGYTDIARVGTDAAIQVVNYENIDKLDLSQYAGVILDECFSPDTPIRVVRNGVLMNTHIKDCLIGDKVLNCIGLDSIKAVKKKKVTYAIKLKFNGESVISSPRHPYFTQRGWVAAKNIQRGDVIIATDKAMRILRSGFCDPQNLSNKDQILRNILLSEMEDETAGTFSKSSQSEGGGKKRSFEISMAKNRRWEKGSGKDKEFESNDQSRNKSQSICYIKSNEIQTFSAWGKWDRHDIATAINEGCIVRDMGCGLSYITGIASEGLSDKLQSRFRQLRNENSDRIGWALSPFKEGPRRKERREIDEFRVESFEVLEPRCPELDKYRDDAGSLYFYDLEIERHPSFTINSGLVHNSSILKNYEGAYRNLIIEGFHKTKYKLACTATPAPNDPMELGNHSEFLGTMGRQEMLAMYYVHDGSETAKWRLKGHAIKSYYHWVRTWATMLTKPSDLGFDDAGYNLPSLNYIEDQIKTPTKGNSLFNDVAVSATEFNSELRRTKEARMMATAEIVNNSNENFVVWVKQNEEADLLKKLIPGCVDVRGSDSNEFKEEMLLGFAENKFRVLVTKSSIASFGLNYQNCHNTVFPSLDFSFEKLYQSIRRFHRFGQLHDVNVHLITTDTMQNVVASIARKQKEFEKMQHYMTKKVLE